MKTITESTIRSFERKLRSDEKSDAAIEKYGRILRKLVKRLDGSAVTHALLIEYRDLSRKDYDKLVAAAKRLGKERLLRLYRP